MREHTSKAQADLDGVSGRPHVLQWSGRLRMASSERRIRSLVARGGTVNDEWSGRGTFDSHGDRIAWWRYHVAAVTVSTSGTCIAALLYITIRLGGG